MKIAVDLNSGYYLILDEAAASLMPAILTAKIATSTGYGTERKFQYEDRGPQIMVVPDTEFEAAPAPLVQLQEDVKSMRNMWHQEYTAHAKTKEELREVKEKLAKISEIQS